MDLVYDFYEKSLRKHQEELCGDAVKITRANGKTVAVLSDGLGSGVKANILATLTSEIVSTMLNNNDSLEEVMRTVLGTLPICQVRNMAYATFTVLEIDERRNRFKVINTDNPPIFYIRDGQIRRPLRCQERILNRDVFAHEGDLKEGDFIGMASDGVLYAGLGKSMNFGWGWEQIGQFLEETLRIKEISAQEIVNALMEETEALYGGEVGDDATFVGMRVRQKRNLILFTGPPLDKSKDSRVVEEFMRFNGRKVVCGGTTANIVSDYLQEPIETDIGSMSEDTPPLGRIKNVDLLTEGIITLSRTIDLLRKNRKMLLKQRNTGAMALLSELLFADHIVIFAGRTINPYYQNPILPKNISIRLSLVNELADLLRSLRKDVLIRLF